MNARACAAQAVKKTAAEGVRLLWKLSAAPIAFQCETLFKALVEHFIPRL